MGLEKTLSNPIHPNEEKAITDLRVELMNGVRERWRTFPRVALLACLLDPRTKNLWFLEQHEQETVKTMLRRKFEERFGRGHEEKKQVEDKANSFLDLVFQGSCVPSDDEVTRYLQSLPIPHTEDPFHWWREHEHEFKNLAVLAKKYLAVPASNAPSERVFSQAKRILERDRNRIDPDHAEQLVLLYYNYDFALRASKSEYLLS